MSALYIPAKDQAALETALAFLDQNDLVQSVGLIMADQDHFTNEVLQPLLARFSKPIAGGIFPEIVFQNERKQSGTLLVPLDAPMTVVCIDLSIPDSQMEEILAQTFTQPPQEEWTMFIMYDALSNGKNALLESVFNHLGNIPKYLGAGAGSLQFERFPCIVDNNGLHEDAAIVALVNKPAAVGVGHGWETITPPLKVTKAEGNKLISINWQSAFSVYQAAIREHQGQLITEDNFFDIAQLYPLGIAKLDDERTVRDPFKVEGETILLLDSINEGEFVCIMHGDKTTLLAGARKAASVAADQAKPDQTNLFLIDCISRVLYLEEQFPEELTTVSGAEPIHGILTLGEIANSGRGYLEFFNKTVVVARW